MSKDNEDKNKIISTTATNKTFEYLKGNVNLKFILRVDIKDDLKDFLDILKKSCEDLEKEILK